MFKKTIKIPPSEIKAPQDFEFQFTHYVFYPEIREGNKWCRILKLKSGKIVKAELESTGTVDKPSLVLTVKAEKPLKASEIKETRKTIAWILGLKEDLKPFYKMIKDDPVMQASLSMNYGWKPHSYPTVFECVIGVVVAQNVLFKRIYTMLELLCKNFGEKITLEGRDYHAFPEPKAIAAASLKDLRACKVGYRDKFLKTIAEKIIKEKVNLESIKKMSNEEALKFLAQLPYVGPYSANLGLVLATKRKDIFHLDLFSREATWTFYFKGKKVDDKTILEFAKKHWHPYEGLAVGLLTTNTEEWAEKLGKKFRLKSGAKGGGK
jgi:3-methyladenine DNA glycosylase/8-oxoguanine DNA glycosylase